MDHKLFEDETDEEMTRTLQALLRRARYVRLARFNRRRNNHFGGLDAFRRRVREAQQVKKGVGFPGSSAASLTRFEVAPQVKIAELEPYVDRLLRAFGFPTALVTDESLVCDMAQSRRTLSGLRRALKMRIEPTDFIYEVAERMQARDQKSKVGLNRN